MSSTSLLVGIGAVLSTLSSIALATPYQIKDTYTADTWLDAFEFKQYDLNGGFVEYVDENTAKRMNMYYKNDDGDIMFGVDSSEKLQYGTAAGRKSVRLEGRTNYNQGLFIIDIKTMPAMCGMWPAFWSLGQEPWPIKGEIDIIEGVNDQTKNKYVLHTNTDCKVNGQGQSGTQASKDCALDGPSKAVGCEVNDARPSSYGVGFNSGKGGVYAMEWTNEAIRTWFFPRGSKLPRSLVAGSPNTDDFGRPAANFQGDCNIEQRFKDQRFIFTNNFCGEWAGNVYAQSGCPKYNGKDGKPLSSMDMCKKYVAENPKDFKNAFWKISSFKTYTKKSVTSSSSSAPSSTRMSSIMSPSSSSTKSSSTFTKASSTTASSTTASSSTKASSASSSASKASSASPSVTASISYFTSATALNIKHKNNVIPSSIHHGHHGKGLPSSTYSDVLPSATDYPDGSPSASDYLSVPPSSLPGQIAPSSVYYDGAAPSSVFGNDFDNDYPASSISMIVHPTVSSGTPHPTGKYDSFDDEDEYPSYDASSSSAPVYDKGYDAKSTPISGDGYDAESSAYGNGKDYPEAAATEPSYGGDNNYKVYPEGSKTTSTATVTYVDVCETGYTTITTTHVVTYGAGPSTPAASEPTTGGEYPVHPPPGFYITTKVCNKGCGNGPTTVTVTIPTTHYMQYPPTTPVPAVPTTPVYPANNTLLSTVYHTKIITLSSIHVPASEYPAQHPSPTGDKPMQPTYGGDEPSTPAQTPAAFKSGIPVQPAVKPSAGYAHPASNGTVHYSTGAKPTASMTGYQVPQFTGAASSVRVGGVVAVFGFAALLL